MQFFADPSFFVRKIESSGNLPAVGCLISIARTLVGSVLLGPPCLSAWAGCNAVELERQLQAMNAIAKASYCRNPESLANELDWLSTRVAEAVDVGRANQLVERSRVALGEGDTIALRGLLSPLWDLQPSAPEQQTRSYGSGIR